jgi:hypothetical protein
VPGPARPEPIEVTPARVVIDDLYPGTTGYGQVALTYVGAGPAEISVTGHLTSDHVLTKADALDMVVAACSQPWAGVPDEPTSVPAPTECDSGEVASSSGSLPALPLEEGQTTYLLISAALPAGAGNAAQGQRWTAEFDVQTTTDAPPARLAVTGADAALWAAAAAAAVGAGAALRRRSHRAERTNR